ncbi:hypothetical protein [Herbidospora sp. RD11066]
MLVAVGVTVLVFNPGMYWLGARVEDLLGVVRPHDEPPLVGLLILGALIVAGVLVYQAVRVRRGGDEVGPALRRWWAGSRERHLTRPGTLAASATVFAAWLCFVPAVVTVSLGFGVLDEGVPPDPGAAGLAAVVVGVLLVLLWAGLRWWLGPGQPRRFLAASMLLRIYLPITVGLMAATILMAAVQVTDEAAWTTVSVLHFAWIVAAFVPLFKVRDSQTGSRAS